MDKQNMPNPAECVSHNSRPELELRLNSLQSLVCELLQANQELREALSCAQLEPQLSRGPRHPAQKTRTA